MTGRLEDEEPAGVPAPAPPGADPAAALVAGPVQSMEEALQVSQAHFILLWAHRLRALAAGMRHAPHHRWRRRLNGRA